jgi:hypothetical protein
MPVADVRRRRHRAIARGVVSALLIACVLAGLGLAALELHRHGWAAWISTEPFLDQLDDA